MDKALNAALATALEFEKKGHDIYESASKKTQNPIVAKTFKYLAEQETFHILEIQGYLKGSKLEFLGDQTPKTQKFFSTTISEFKHKTKLSDNDIKAHETALELEKNAYHFYMELFGKTKDPELKQFFEFLYKQEKNHYELIKRAYDFVQDPAAFYQKQDDAIFEGW
jgi:rubrerythrin